MQQQTSAVCGESQTNETEGKAMTWLTGWGVLQGYRDWVWAVWLTSSSQSEIWLTRKKVRMRKSFLMNWKKNDQDLEFTF